MTLNFKVFYISGCIFVGLKLIYQFYMVDKNDPKYIKAKEKLELFSSKELQALIILIGIMFFVAGSWFLELYFLLKDLIEKHIIKGDESNEK